jgi:CheY-like chemotaxis protein
MFQKFSSVSRRVLVADDDPVIRCVLTSIIEKEGYNVVLAKDGREAFRIIQSDANFCSAIFDMMMPTIDGLDIIRHMRTERRLMRIPVLIVTSERDLKFTAECFAAGATVFLPKPFTPAQFLRTFNILLSERRVAA